MPYKNHQDYATSCDYCREELTGEQSRFCSQNCRVKYRYHGGPAPAFITCELCGERLHASDRRKRRCEQGEDTMPGETCWELQEAEVEAKHEAENARDFPACAHCGAEAEYMGGEGKGGRHRKYCSDKCRVYAHRARKGRKTRASA